MARDLQNHLSRVLRRVCPDPTERARLARLMALFARLPPPPDPDGLVPRYAQLRERFVEILNSDDGEVIEERFLELYAHLHMHEAPYTAEERRRVDRSGGYWCHAGGLSPVLKAGDWLEAGSTSVDLGAGNGLQGLLIRKLYPHARTTQIEISSRMVSMGRALQRWLEIPENQVEWMVADVLDTPIPPAGFIYLYRPVRPEGPGRAFYERLAAALDGADHPVVIFSIADCLRPFLSDAFEVLYGDGHLTIFRKA